MSSRVERKHELRARRIAHEREARASEQRKRRLKLLGACALAAVAVVAVLIAASQGGSDDQGGLGTGERLVGARAANELFEGIPQRGATLGDPDAPVRMVEFVDLQCPFCAQFSREALPELVERYVRSGQVKLELRPLTFIGTDSVEAGAAAAAAAKQERMWQFVDLLYRNQGAENSGYVTPELLRRVARAAGLDPRPVVAAARAGAGGALLERAKREAERLGVESTPSFFVARRDGRLDPLQVTELTPEAFAPALDQALRAR